jgi:hypothetical protein
MSMEQRNQMRTKEENHLRDVVDWCHWVKEVAEFEFAQEVLNYAEMCGSLGFEFCLMTALEGSPNF